MFDLFIFSSRTHADRPPTSYLHQHEASPSHPSCSWIELIHGGHHVQSPEHEGRGGDRREQRDRAGGVPAARRQWCHRRVNGQGRDEGRGRRREAQRHGALQRHLPPAGDHRLHEHRPAGRFPEDPFREARHPGKQCRSCWARVPPRSHRRHLDDEQEVRWHCGRVRADRLAAEMVLPGDPRRRERVPEDQLPRHEAGDRSPSAAAAGLRRWPHRQRLLRARPAKALRRRGAAAGAGRRGVAERGEGGRGGGGVREGAGGFRRGGGDGPPVAGRRDGGVRGVEGGAERLFPRGGAAAPRGARQLRPPRVRAHRHDRQLRLARAGRRRRTGGPRGAAPRRWAHRRVLRRAPAGILRVT